MNKLTVALLFSTISLTQNGVLPIGIDLENVSRVLIKYRYISQTITKMRNCIKQIQGIMETYKAVVDNPYHLLNVTN